MNISTEILNYDDGSSDKVYIVEISLINGIYNVTTYWGPREASVLTSRIIYTGTDKVTAEYHARVTLKKKRNKGYAKASKHLNIPGYKVSQTNTAAIAADRATSKEVVSNTIPTGRKIKL